ncbi:MAG: cell division protein SepF [Propionibacteriaceae bacterium]|nr:cell division protein SepF [Propionibacteriaceae bacterium]
MPSKLKRVAEWAGIVQSGRYDDEDEFAPEEELTSDVEVTEVHTEAVPVRQTNVTSIVEHRSRKEARSREATFDEIAHVKPKSYAADATRIAESYRDGVPVIINLSDMDNADAFRLIDFAAGLRFALDGTLEKITARVFLLTPPSIRVTDRDKERLVAGNLLAAQG